MIIVSDLHLGRKDSKVNEFLQFIKDHPTDKLVLNGDIFDQIAMFKNSPRLYMNEHRPVVREIRKILKDRNTKIHYNIGNHDWLLLFLIPIGFLFGARIRIRLKIGNYIIEHGNLIRPYLKAFGITIPSKDHHKEWLAYARLRNKILIVGHSHHPIKIDGIVIDEGDWVKHMTHYELIDEKG